MKNGKGDKRRPTNEATYRDNYGTVFGSPLPIEKRPYEADPIEHAEPEKDHLDSEWANALERAGLKVANLFE